MEKQKEIVDSRGRPRVATTNTMESRTIQSDADKADITKILQKYSQVGIVDHLNMAEAKYMDVTEFTDLADALNQSKQAEVEFMKLPSKVREIFGHDVAEWLDTAHDPEKRDALVAAGIIKGPEKVVEEVVPGGGPGGEAPKVDDGASKDTP